MKRLTFFLYLLLFLVAFIPRTLALDAFVAPDEGKWIYRSAHFLEALLAGEPARMTSVAATPEVEVLAPAVTTMWTGALGLAANYWLGQDRQGSLETYLNQIPDQTEKTPLNFYPWARFPTVLLTSLSILVFYFLLSKLVGRGAALLAALLLALDPFFIGLSRVIHHDALVSIFITGSLLTVLVYGQRDKSPGWLILSGVAGGLALATKPTALYLVVFVSLFLLGESLRPFFRKERDQPASFGAGSLGSFGFEILSWGVTALLTFVLVWPAMWAAPITTLAALVERSTRALSDNNNYSLLPGPGTPLPELGFLYYPVNWLLKATLPALLGLAGLVGGWRRGRLLNPWDGPGTGQSRPATRIWTVKWLTLFVLLFLILLIPADTRDIRYFLPAVPALYGLSAVGIIILLAPAEDIQRPPSDGQKLGPIRSGKLLGGGVGLLLILQLALTVLYFPYFVDYWNPAVGGPWLAPHLTKIGSGEGLDQMGRYLSQKAEADHLTVATSFWESFVPFFPGNYTKAHYDEEADYILIYIRQIQNRNPFPEYWTYFSARSPEHKVSLMGVDYAWLYAGPQLYVIREADYNYGLTLQGYRLDRWAAQPGKPAHLSLVWSAGVADQAGRPVLVRLMDQAGQVWVKTTGPVLAPEGPSPVEGHYVLDIPVDMPRGDYELWVSVADVSHRVGEIPIRHLEKPAVQMPISANFGNLITLEGANISPPTLLPGKPVDIDLLWQARQPVSESLTTFVHVVDDSGQIWGQADRLPGDGRWPTNTWDKKEWIRDRFQLSLKPDTPAGSYRLLVGIYNSQTLERLPVIAQEGAETVVELTSIEVMPE